MSRGPGMDVDVLVVGFGGGSLNFACTLYVPHTHLHPKNPGWSIDKRPQTPHFAPGRGIPRAGA